MNASEAWSHDEPLNLTKQASDHEFRVRNLYHLIAHMEDYFSHDVPDAEGHAILSMVVAAKDMASRAYEEAEELNIYEHRCGMYLMAMPVEVLAGDITVAGPIIEERRQLQRVRSAYQVVTNPEATADEMVNALSDIYQLELDDEAYGDDLDALVAIVELRGYEVGWLTFPTGRRPHLAPRRDDGQTGREAGAPIDARACLTTEEIEVAARTMAAGLEGYLVSALSRPANDGLTHGGA